MNRFGMRQFAQPSFATLKALVPAALLLAGPMALQAGAQDTQAPAAAGAAGVTFYTGANLTGSSKTLTLGPDQPYTSIPYVGDELNEQINSLAADAQVGAILFQRPYFASRDDACGPNLGTAADPDSVWLGLTADFAPPAAGDGTYEAPTLPDGDYSSVIAYRRDIGPPPGFLLLERRSYYNRACERSADQSYFNRIFIPVPNPPQREACTDLSVPASAHGAGADAPRFVRVTDAVALQPYHFSRSYQGIEHRFLLTLFAGPGCSGETISLPSSENGRSGAYRLSDYEFDRKVKSVAVRYLRGPLDRYLADAPAEAQAELTAPAPTTPAPTAPAASSSAPGTITVPTPQPAPPPSAATSGTAQQQQLTAPPASGTQASGAQTSGAQASGSLQPAPPTAPPQQQQQALQPVPVPVPQAAPVPSRPTGPQEETFRFPVHQSYRLNYCLEDEQGCGEPAATAWCEASGFARATRWAQEDNIGALYPTVFIGSGSICDKFLCDGFEEITCSQ